MEWIKYHEAEKVFDLRTENSTYQMQVREYDTLVHLYYGCPVGDSLITDRIVCVDRGFSGNPYEAGKDKTFSLDTLPQEYTAYGNGDYRINGLEVEQADGSDTANLKFESYKITKGKYSLKGLPAMFAKEDEAETLEIVLADRVSGLKAHLLYSVFPHLDVITRAVRLEQTGETPVTVKKAMSMEMDFEYREMDAVHFYGRHNVERQSGKGTEVGRNFEELRQIIDRVELKDKLGVCLDTCHVWDGGYDIVNDLDSVFEEFDRIIGLDRLKAIHLNDSMNPLGSHKDRHARIGEGEIGLEALVRVINHPATEGIPFILETPNDDEGWTHEIALFRNEYKQK